MVSAVGAVVVGGALAAGVGALALASYLYGHRDSPGVYWFIGSILAVSAWCLTYGVALLVSAMPLRAHLTAVWLAPAIWTGPLFLLFALRYTGRGVDARSRATLVILSVPAVGTGLLATYPFHTVLWTGMSLSPVFGLATMAYTLQPVAYIVTGYTLLTTTVAVLLLVETITSYGPLYRGEAIAVALSAVPPAIGAALWLFGWGPVPQLNLAPTLFVLHLLLDGYAFVGRDMFETNPTTRRAAERSAIDDIVTPVLSLDPDGRVVTVNDAALDLFGRDRHDVLGRPVTEFVGIDPASDDSQSVTRTTDGRKREFTVETSPLTDPAENHVGRTVVLQEVTQEREREQRLDVLNRVIRHNLRNEMTVILGHADHVEEQTSEDDIAAAATKITGSAERLLATGEKARQFERIRGGERTVERVDVADLVALAVADLDGSFPAATVDIDVAPGTETTAMTMPRVLSLVVTNLVENALAHNDTDSPRAVVSLVAGADGLEIHITDNGPGIDPVELEPIRDGGETELEHSTGIGLWVASWGVTMLGGDIEFTTDEDGTEVVVTLA